MLRLLVTVFLVLSSFSASEAWGCAWLFSNDNIARLKTAVVEVKSLEEVARSFHAEEYERVGLEDFVQYDARSITSKFRKLPKSSNRMQNGYVNKGIFVKSINGVNFLAKMFAEVNEGFDREKAEVNQTRYLKEAGYVKMMSDLGWGPKLYGILVNEGLIVGILMERVPGELAKDWYDDLDKDLPYVKLAFKRRELLEEIGISVHDFQFILDHENEKAWIIDTPWYLKSLFYNESTESIAETLSQGNE